MRYPLPLALAVLALTAACAEAPTETTVVDRPNLLESSPPPPPPVTGVGTVSFTSTTESAALGVTAVCVEPVFDPIPLEGIYFQNNTGNNAWIHFSPILVGSGLGIIHQTTQDVDEFDVPIIKKTDASGTLRVMDIANLVQQDIHLLDYPSDLGTSLFLTDGSFGSIFGTLVAEVTACGGKISYTGDISFSWGVPPCSECEF